MSLPPFRPRRLHDLIAPWVVQQPDRLALRDDHVRYSYAELEQAADATAEQLHSAGVRAGDRVVIVGENCAATPLIALATSRLDAWVCIVNGRLSAREVDNVIAHATPRRVLYTTRVSTEAVGHAERHGAEAIDWPQLGPMHLGPLNADAVPEPCSADAREQVAALIYTSGTSGAPKGVMLTHANLIFTAGIAGTVRGMHPQDLVYGVLPMAHIVGLATQVLGALASGAGAWLSPRFAPERLVAALSEGVTSFTGVPAMYARLLDWLREQGRTLDAPQLRAIGVAGSPLTLGLKAAIETAFGHPVLNGYGLTETAPTIAQVRADAPRSDCAVGQPVPGIAVRVVGPDGADLPPGDTGELWVRGPNVMKGYYRNAALTAEVLGADGWFRTGDAGTLSTDGKLTLTERIKDLFKTSNGKYIAPQETETRLELDKYIEQAVTIGDERNYVTAIIVPAIPALEEYAKQHKIGYESVDALLKHPKIHMLIEERIAEQQKGMAHYELIKKFTLIKKGFTIETGELTNTLKLRRTIIMQKYKDLIDAMYEKPPMKI